MPICFKSWDGMDSGPPELKGNCPIQLPLVQKSSVLKEVKEVFDCSTIIEESLVPRVAKLQLT